MALKNFHYKYVHESATDHVSVLQYDLSAGAAFRPCGGLPAKTQVVEMFIWPEAKPIKIG